MLGRLLRSKPLASSMSTRVLGTTPLARSMSTRIVATIVGPDRIGIMNEVSRIITENDSKVHDTRAQALGGTFSMMAEVEVVKDSAALGFALQSSLPGYVTTLRPEGEVEAEAVVFGRLDLKRFPALAVVSRVTEAIASHSIGIATLRTSEHSEGYYSATATLSSPSKDVDYQSLEIEFAELADKLNIDLEFKKLNPATN